jgi:hypothetical protein
MPADSLACDCGFPVGEAASLELLHGERHYRNLYLFANAFTALGVVMILASFIGPPNWEGIAQGLSGVCGAWAFWSLVESEDETNGVRLRRRFEYAALTFSVGVTVLVVVRMAFDPSPLLWLVMPASYVWRAYHRRRRSPERQRKTVGKSADVAD